MAAELKPLSLRHEAKYCGYREWESDTKVEGRIQAFHELIHVGEPDMQAGDHHSQGYG